MISQSKIRGCQGKLERRLKKQNCCDPTQHMILPDQIHSKQSKDLIKKSARRFAPSNSVGRMKTRQTGSVDALKKQNKFTWVSAKRKAVDGVWKSAPFPRHLSKTKKYKSERIIKIKNTLWLLYKCEKMSPHKINLTSFFFYDAKKSPPRIYGFFSFWAFSMHFFVVKISIALYFWIFF